MRICSEGGCTGICADTARYCPEHAAENRAGHNDGIRSHSPASTGIKVHSNAARDVLQKLYESNPWQDGTRPAILRRDPFCKMCDRAMSVIVDHIVPALEALRQVRESGRFRFNPNAGFFLRTNLQGLCRSCHKKKTDEDKAHTGEWPSVLAKEDATPKKQWKF